MRTISLSAQFDGQHIVLDEPYELKPNTRLLVTIIPEETIAEEREAWFHLAAQGLARAYGDDEPEYARSMIKEPNPNYDSKHERK
jgi:hypothetical protein